MSNVIAQRMTARIEGDFVVFLIGMRINKLWKVWKWAPVARQMPQMLAELAAQPQLGLLHARTHFGLPNILVVQYWRSFEHLHEYGVYNNMPPYGLGVAGSLQPAQGRMKSAKGRLGLPENAE
jgi:hypothetical protein